jgi:hypothetical protein
MLKVNGTEYDKVFPFGGGENGALIRAPHGYDPAALTGPHRAFVGAGRHHDLQ